MDTIAVVSNAAPKIATEALYFALRALKQAGLSGESKKDYFHDSEGSLPSEASVSLAKAVLESICTREGVADVDNIPRFRVGQYILEVARASDEIATRSANFSVGRGVELLKKMRKAEAGEA